MILDDGNNSLCALESFLYVLSRLESFSDFSPAESTVTCKDMYPWNHSLFLFSLLGCKLSFSNDNLYDLISRMSTPLWLSCIGVIHKVRTLGGVRGGPAKSTLARIAGWGGGSAVSAHTP